MTKETSNHKSTEVLGGERYLAFSLCKEQYAIPLPRVKEVIGYQQATPIPQSPAYFKGVINLRGQIISILDLRTKLKLAKSEQGPETAIIILDLQPFSVGIVVDTVDSVHAIPAGEIESGQGIEGFASRSGVAGIAKKDKQLIILLDVNSIVDAADAAIVQQNSKKSA